MTTEVRRGHESDSFGSRQRAELWAIGRYGRELPGVTFHERKAKCAECERMGMPCPTCWIRGTERLHRTGRTASARVECYVRPYDPDAGYLGLRNGRTYVSDEPNANCHRCWPTPAIAKRLVEALQREHLAALVHRDAHDGRSCEFCSLIAEAKG